jgi:murein DD-endopeptidase MepM/ murein hydrolase activator NlpD
MASTIIVQNGQTLSEIAREYHTSVAELVRLNHLKNANFIVAGQQLILSDKPASRTAQQPRKQEGATLPVIEPAIQLQSTQSASATAFIKDGRSFPNNNGYPVYAQGLNSATGTREDWARLPIGNSDISNIGCAMTSVAMAISGIGGQAITPDEMNRFMNKIGGFNSEGGIQAWPRMGELVKPQVKVTRRFGVNANVIDQELKAGRPVVVQVDYHDGRGKGAKAGYDGVGDHWILIVGRTPDNRYLVNDPAGGKMMTLHRMADGRLEADSADNKHKTKYRTTGSGTTFDRGPGAPSAGGVVVAAKSAGSKAKTTTASETSTPKPTSTAPAKNTASKGSKAPADLLQAPPEVEQLIRNAATKVGVDYGYMMAMAAQESSFRTSIAAKGKTSSAVGLYQFIKQSWLGMVKLHGAKHGLANHAARISYSKSDKKWVVTPPEKAQEILALRENGNYNALLAAEYAKDNQSLLTKKLGRSVSPTELYMAHFLGPGNAAKFLTARDAGKGNQSAADMFPDAAEANPSIFYSGTTLVVLKNERTLNEVYSIMEKKIAPKADAYTIQLQDRAAETNTPVASKVTEKKQTEIKPTTASTGVGAHPKSKSDFCFPFPKLPSQSWKTGARVFGALRSGGKRKHAGCDLYFPAGTWIHAVADGEVIQQPYNFYAGTQALEIRHGSIIVRYGEIQPNSFVGGKTVKKGQRICKVGHLIGINVESDMLHIEMYAGTESGNLTAKENKPYQRRKDLLDPTPFLDAWSANLPSSPSSSS